MTDETRAALIAAFESGKRYPEARAALVETMGDAAPTLREARDVWNAHRGKLFDEAVGQHKSEMAAPVGQSVRAEPGEMGARDNAAPNVVRVEEDVEVDIQGVVIDVSEALLARDGVNYDEIPFAMRGYVHSAVDAAALIAETGGDLTAAKRLARERATK